MEKDENNNIIEKKRRIIEKLRQINGKDKEQCAERVV